MDNTIFIPYFAHKAHGGKRGTIIKTTKKKVTIRLLNEQKNISINKEFIQHAIDKNWKTIKQKNWVSQFETTKELGKGAYGSVVSVIHKHTHQKFALKTVIPQFPGLNAIIIEECVIFQDLVHPNLVKPIHIHCEFNKNEQQFYIYFLMEEMTMSLRGLQKKYQFSPMPPQLCSFIVTGMLQGIAHMNYKGYSHSDLSPNNVLIKTVINSNGEEIIDRVCLTDFSLSRSLDGRYLPTRIVTLWYRAPELFANYKSFTLAINTWSVAIICLECICGHPIFWKNCEQHTIDRIVDLCGRPTPEWIQQYGEFKSTHNNDNRSSLTRIKNVLEPRTAVKVDKKVLLTTEYTNLIHFIKEGTRYDPQMRISPNRALTKYFNSSYLAPEYHNGHDQKEEKGGGTIVTIHHFKLLCTQMLYQYRDRLESSFKDILSMSVRLFNNSCSTLQYCQWSLAMIACCTLACKRIVYSRIAKCVQPDVPIVLESMNNVYSEDDVKLAECFIMNNGGLKDM